LASPIPLKLNNFIRIIEGHRNWYWSKARVH